MIAWVDYVQNENRILLWKIESVNKECVEDYGAVRRVRKGEFIAETGKPFLVFFYSAVLQPASGENKQWNPLRVGHSGMR